MMKQIQHLKKKHERRIDRVERSLNISPLPSSIEILETDFESFFNDLTTVEFLIPKSAVPEILSGRDWKNLPTDTFFSSKKNPIDFWMWQELNDRAEIWIYEEGSKLRILVSSVQFYESGLTFSEKDNVSGSKPFQNEEAVTSESEGP